MENDRDESDYDSYCENVEIGEETNSKENVLHIKEFKLRNSLLDDIMENEHVYSVYRIFLVIFLGCVVHLMVYEYRRSGEFSIGQKLIIQAFEKFDKFMITWICFFLVDCCIYYGFRNWSNVRITIPKSSRKLKFWDYSCLTAFIAYFYARLGISTWIIIKQEMQLFQMVLMCIETTRMLMKLYAFVRSNVPKVYKPGSEKELLPSFTQFLYFLWIPTLMYQDSYPKSESIRWNHIAAKVVEFFAGMLFISALLERYIIITFTDYGKRIFSWTDLAAILTENAASGVLISLTGHYLCLHVWMGAFAEICRFGDRLFYEDWWTSSSSERFFRTCNVIVYDWLYAYIYKDIYQIILPGKKLVAKWTVFFLTAIFVEYILFTSFGFVLPVLFIQFFVLGTIFTFVRIKPAIIGNVLILYGFALGSSITYTLYGMEYFARINCPIENGTMYAYVIPRIISCGIGNY